MYINGYKLNGDLKNANSGFSKWGFATKKGKEYFIKELINPVYPVDRSIMSEEMFLGRRAYCEEYEAKFRKFFEQINKASRGSLVRIEEFFRCGSRYYIVTEKVEGSNVSLESIASMSKEQKLLLLKTVAQSFADLHSVGIVHFDVKASNVILKKTRKGNYTAKVIDFDSGFVKGESLESKELGGDLVYLAPETVLAMCGEPVRPDEKADIFSMGLLFHEYYCGCMPFYNKDEYDYPYEAVLDGGGLSIDGNKVPEELEKLIASMLSVEPKERPSAEEIVKKISEISAQKLPSEIKNITIRFGDYYGKTICAERGMIRYRNTIHPAVSSEASKFPPDYSMEYKKEISDEQFEQITSQILSAGLLDLSAKISAVDSRPGAVFQNLLATFDDGTTCEYLTCSKAEPEFEKITEILSRYCTFPEIDPSWYEVDNKEEDKEADIASSPERKNGDWFTCAGDL